jgi:hypothetical protein
VVAHFSGQGYTNHSIRYRQKLYLFSCCTDADAREGAYHTLGITVM